MRGIRKRRLGRPGSTRARAAAVVEFAVVLPLLLTILFGIIEYGWIFMARQTLQQAAREGCRVGILQASTSADVQTRVDQVLGAAGLTGYTYSYTPASPPGTVTETVTVSVPMEDISLTGGVFGLASGGTLVGTCSMRKEGV